MLHYRYSDDKMPDKALEIFQQMNEIFGCNPGIRSCNSLLNAFVMSYQYDRAESFFTYFETRFETNLETHNVVMNGDFVNAFNVFNEMPERGVSPDVVCYNCLIDGLFNFKIWQHMLMNEHRPDSFTFCTLIHGLCKSGNVDGAYRNDQEWICSQAMLCYVYWVL
ncbi:hypothetical protein MKW92_039795 [Papaver armeniacum]|nr:hypothetical protein MKW92_039795 [Papaver armeniacum]